jgi:hypothetical protein
MLITMGCGDDCPYIPGLRREDWPLPDPKGQGSIPFARRGKKFGSGFSIAGEGESRQGPGVSVIDSLPSIHWTDYEANTQTAPSRTNSAFVNRKPVGRNVFRTTF